MNFRLGVFILISCLILAAAHLFVYTQNISLKYQLTDAKIALTDLNSQLRNLASSAARGEKLAPIEKIAREKLGMIYPEKVIYLVSSAETGSPRENR